MMALSGIALLVAGSFVSIKTPLGQPFTLGNWLTTAILLIGFCLLMCGLLGQAPH